MKIDLTFAVGAFFIFFFACFCVYSITKIEHEKTIQKAIECGYQPLCIGGDYWNKGD